MNGCNNAKGKPIADKELWVKIYEILNDVRIYHQTSQTKQTTKSATENREVDALLDKQLKFKCQAPRISAHSVQNTSQETYDHSHHPSTKWFETQLRADHVNFPRWK